MRTKLKKLTSVCLAVIMILSVLTVAPVTAGAAEETGESVSETSGDFEYIVLDDGTASIIGYSGSEANLTIPSEIVGYTVTEISWGAFKGKTSLTSVIIPDSVIFILDGAFQNCENLTSITIPDSVSYIGEYALGYIYYKDSREYEKIDGFTVYGYTNSEADVYARNNGFKFVSLGEASPFGYNVLEDGMAELTKYRGSEADLTIPSEIDGYTVTEIGWEAFCGNTSLVSVTIPSSVTYAAFGAFANCPNLKSVTIPASVQDIGSHAFGYVYSVDLGHYDYVAVDGFTIYGYTNSVADVYARENGFDFVSLGEVSPFGYDVLSDGTAEIIEYRGNEANLTIPSEIDGYTIISICGDVFYKNTSLTSVIIPDSVTYIGSEAFADCKNLKSVTISSSVTCIEYNTFNGCTSLTSVTIPDSVTSIGSGAFANTALSDITIPASVQDIYENAFGYIYNEDSWEYEKVDGFTISGYTNSEADVYARENGFDFVSLGEVSPFGYDVLLDGTAIITKYRGSGENLTIPSEIDGYTVTKIDWDVFKGKTNLKSVTIPDSVTYIGGYAFADCVNLKSITIPASVQEIGECAVGYFYYIDSNLMDDYIRADGFIIYGYANSEADFYASENGFDFVSLGEASPFGYDVLLDGTAEITKYRGSETDLTIPSEIDGYTVTNIGYKAFCSNTSLVSVTIPDSVKFIRTSAFLNCENLKSVTIPDSVTYIDDYAFDDCKNLKSVTIPASVRNIGKDAFGYVFDENVWEYVKADNFTISGYTGSEAERYAVVNDITFISLGDAPAQSLGDVNGDGSISIDDVTEIQKYLANMLDFTSEQAKLADVDKNGSISIDDVTLIQKYIAGLAVID